MTQLKRGSCVRPAKDQDAVAKIREVLTLLVNEKQLPAKNRPHPLAGNYQNYMECHIKPDLLLVYRINDNLLILELFRIGSHSELF